MMKTLFTFLLALGGTLCISCDPVRRIDMINRSGDSVEIIWTMNEDSLMHNPFLLSNSKELKFKLFPPKNNTIKMSFGAGGWSPKEVKKLVGSLESLEIISPSQKFKIDSLPLLQEFLMSRRKGVGGARIEIVISN